jgi:hypothetical protein
MTLPSCSKNGAPLKEDPAAANCQSGSPIIRAETHAHAAMREGAEVRAKRRAGTLTSSGAG